MGQQHSEDKFEHIYVRHISFPKSDYYIQDGSGDSYVLPERIYFEYHVKLRTKFKNRLGIENILLRDDDIYFTKYVETVLEIGYGLN